MVNSTRNETAERSPDVMADSESDRLAAISRMVAEMHDRANRIDEMVGELEDAVTRLEERQGVTA